MKTSKKEQEERIKIYKEDEALLESWLKKLKEAKTQKEKDKILETPEFLEIRQKFSLGPTYIIWKEDYEDPNYKMAFEKHPSEYKILRDAYEKGYYGALVEKIYWKGKYAKRKCIALGYDYGDFYYVIEDDNGGYFFETMCSPVKISNEEY